MNRNYPQSGSNGDRPERYPQQEWSDDEYRFGHRYRVDRPSASQDDEDRGSESGRRGSSGSASDRWDRDYGMQSGRGSMRDEERSYLRRYDQQSGTSSGRYEAGTGSGYGSRGNYGSQRGSEPWGYGEHAGEREMSGARGRGNPGGQGAGPGAQGRWNSMRGREDYSDDAGYGSGQGYGGSRYAGYGGYDAYAEGDNGRSGGRGGYAEGYEPSGYAHGRGYGQGSVPYPRGGYSQSGWDRGDREFRQGGRDYAQDAGAGRWDEGYGRQRIAGFGGGYDNPADRAQGGGYGMGSRQGYRGRGPKGYQRSDERVKEDLCERLSDDPQIDASDISIEVSGGRVTLSGEVEQRWMKHHVENLVDACAGVQDIDNQLRVARGTGASSMRDGGTSSSASGTSGSGSTSPSGGSSSAGSSGNGGAGSSAGGTEAARRKQ